MEGGISLDPMKQEPAYETRIDSDRGTIAQVALALLFCVGFTALETRYLVLGRVQGASLTTLLTALCCFVLVIKSKEMLLKVAFALIGIQGSARFILTQVHAPYAIRRLAAIGGRWLIIVGLLIAIFAILKWFRSVIRRTPTPDPKGPTS
jgi:hypothetical protein